MPDTMEGKIQMAKLTQKLDDHIATQINDTKIINDNINEVKNMTVRIESKLDIKADRDDVDKLAAVASNKLDHDAIKPIKEKLDLLEGRVWYMVGAVILTVISLVINYVFKR